MEDSPQLATSLREPEQLWEPQWQENLDLSLQASASGYTPVALALGGAAQLSLNFI